MVNPRALHGVFIVASNAVPLFGVLYYGWSATTILTVFWAETLVNGTANVVRIYVHRRWTQTHGHYYRRRNRTHSRKKAGKRKPAERASFLMGYVVILYPFTFAHGIFLFGVLAMLFQNQSVVSTFSEWMDFAAVRSAIVVIGLLATIECLVDLASIADKPFSWLEKRVDTSIGHIAILHLGLLGGAILLANFETPLSFLAVLVVLKTLFELGASRAAHPYPSKPTRWFSLVMSKLGRDPSKEWAQLLKMQEKKSEEDKENEKVIESI